MTIWRKLALIFFLSLIGFAIFLYLHLGLNREVAIRQGEIGPLYLLYKAHRGAYHEIGPVIREVEIWAANNNVACPRTFGEYIDAPDRMDQDRLRSHGGCLLNGAPSGPLPEGFIFRELTPKKYVIASFDGSPAAGPLTAYPAVSQYLESERLRVHEPVIEIYEVNGPAVTTEYLFELKSP